jgi:hypothetical protein
MIQNGMSPESLSKFLRTSLMSLNKHTSEGYVLGAKYVNRN